MKSPPIFDLPCLLLVDLLDAIHKSCQCSHVNGLGIKAYNGPARGNQDDPAGLGVDAGIVQHHMSGVLHQDATITPVQIDLVHKAHDWLHLHVAELAQQFPGRLIGISNGFLHRSDIPGLELVIVDVAIGPPVHRVVHVAYVLLGSLYVHVEPSTSLGGLWAASPLP